MIDHHPTIGSVIGYGQWLRLRAAAGELVEAYEAADILGVKPDTIRVWTHRGKLAPVEYRQSAWGGQKTARYALADVLALADMRSAKPGGA